MIRKLLLIASAIVLASCASATSVDSGITEDVLDITLKRTYAYLNDEATEEFSQVMQAEILIRDMTETGERVPVTSAVLKAVETICDVHDKYVSADEALTDEAKGHYLRTTELFRRMYQEAGSE